MAHIIESPFLQLVINAEDASWSLASRQERFPTVEAARMEVWYRMGRGLFLALSRWNEPQWFALQTVASPHGNLKQIGLTFLDENGVRYLLTFALAEQQPLMFWKIAVRNDTRRTLLLQRLVMLETKRYHPKGNPGFFSNGWQSWSYTGAYGRDDRFKRTRLGPLLAPMRVNHGTPHPRSPGHFGSDMFAVLADRHSRTGLLTGFLSQKQNFGSLEARLATESSTLRLWATADNVHLEPGKEFSTDWACLNYLAIDDPDPLGPYLEAVAREHEPYSFELPDSRPALGASNGIPTGWCSWYHFFQKVTQEDMRRNLQAACDLRSELPLGLFQLDDGFEAQVGDWFHFNKKFPGGVASLAAEIRASGFTPGLWLAPFIVHPRSRLAAVHPDWLLRNRFNWPVNAGFIWNVFTSALDLTHPDAMQYACEVIQTAVQRWGYPFLKLDFLYAAALTGRRRDPGRTRAQVLRAGLEALRQVAGPQIYLLGCDCPLGSAIGLVQAMRIGADVDRRWSPSHFGIKFFFKAETDMPSARNAIQNSLTRAPLHRRWWVNDPGCLLLQPETQLTQAEIYTLATVIAITGGALLLSGDLSTIPAERLRIAQQLLPLIGQRPRVLDWFDSATPARVRLDVEGAVGAWHLLALFNWSDQDQALSLKLADFDLPSGIYNAREFWSGSLSRIGSDQLAWQIPAHGVALFALRPAAFPQFLGSDLHVSQGLEVKHWEVVVGTPTQGSENPEFPPRRLKITLERPGRADGEIVLGLRQPPQEATLNGVPTDWRMTGENCYSFPVAFEKSGLLEVEW
jgi:alpha-galactosidase